MDDGLLVVDRKKKEMVRKSVNDRFAVKEWKDLEQVSETFLGVKTKYENYEFTDDMTEYIEQVKYAPEETPDGAPLEGKQLSAFRRLIMQLCWPSHHVLPEFLYRTSNLAQRASEAKGGDLKYANKILKGMKEVAQQGKAKMKIF